MAVRALMGLAIAASLGCRAAYADLLIEIDKSSQSMTVTRNGAPLYKWPVSTGADGYDTPSGDFRPFRMEIDHHSDEYEQAPMPHAIFFTMTGNAVHGTFEERSARTRRFAGSVEAFSQERRDALGSREAGEDGQHHGRRDRRYSLRRPGRGRLHGRGPPRPQTPRAGDRRRHRRSTDPSVSPPSGTGGRRRALAGHASELSKPGSYAAGERVRPRREAAPSTGRRRLPLGASACARPAHRCYSSRGEQRHKRSAHAGIDLAETETAISSFSQRRRLSPSGPKQA